MYLPDINVWLAMAFEAHGHHTAARDWFGEIREGGCYFCRFTQAGFLRLATNPTLLGGEALTLADAWSVYDRILADDRIDYSPEPIGLDHLWRELTMTRKRSPKVWNDAYLAAFAKAGGLQLVTFDSGFSKYKGVDCRILRKTG